MTDGKDMALHEVALEGARASLAAAREREAEQRRILDETRGEVKILEAMISAAVRVEGRQRESNGHVRPNKTDAHRAAGPTAIHKTAVALKKLGRASQAALTRETGLHSGSVSWALKALVEDDQVADTGERERGSKVYEAREAIRVGPGE